MVAIIFFLAVVLSLIVFFIYKLVKSYIHSTNKDLIITFISTVFIFNIAFNPEVSLKATLNGLKLFINSVFVSIFPFLILINIMLSYDGVNIYSKVFGNLLCRPLRLPKCCSVVLIISILCGYPLGAKYASDLYGKKLIDFNTFERLISIASNPSPIFVLGAVGTSMLNSPSMGLLLLISCYLSCFVMGIIIPAKPYCNLKFRSSKNLYNSLHNTNTFGEVLKSSIENAFITSFSIGGFIIFFSVLTAIIKNNILFDIVFEKLHLLFYSQKEIFQSFFIGLLEMTNGCSLVSNLTINNVPKIIIISFLLGFSGLSIISQTYSITYKTNLSFKKYVIKKFIQGIICSVITFILYTSDIFKTSMSTSTLENFMFSGFDLTAMLIFQIVVLVVPFIIFKTKNLFNSIS